MEDFSRYLRLVNNCDPSDPLLSSTSLGTHLEQIPLIQVDRSYFRDLTQALNPKQLIHTDEGLARDYRGLAEIMGFNSIQIDRFERSNNPTRTLIESYITSIPNQPAKFVVTMNGLLKMLERLERFDVIDDFLPSLIKLVDMNQLDSNYQRLKIFQSNEEYSNHLEVSKDMRNLSLTKDDDYNVPNAQVIIYDAFICYAPEDHEYANELISHLEERGARVSTADDLLPGNFEHDAMIRLIEMRCRKVIIILTPNFCNSKECDFQTKFATEIGIKVGTPKIIPLVYEKCDDYKLPGIIKVLSKIDMTNRSNHDWKMQLLVRSLEMVDTTDSNSPRLPRIPLNHSNRTGAITRDGSNTSTSSHYFDHQQYNDNLYVPELTFHSNQQRHDQISTIGDPIVEIPPSQDSLSTFSTLSVNNSQPSREISPSSVSSYSINGTKNWLKNVKRIMMGSNSSSPGESSTTSQAFLIQSDTSDTNSSNITSEDL